MYKTLSAPLTAQIELCSACTNNCLHCYNFWRNSGHEIKYASLSPDQIRVILEKLAKAKVFDIIITGGEPLLNKKGLYTCLKEVNRYGMAVSLNSNLVPLTFNSAKILSGLGLKNILTSVLGPNAEIHDYIAQRKGVFEKTIRNINLAVSGGMNVVVNMVISRLNIGYIKETARLVASLGVRKFACTKAGCPGNCGDFSGLSINLKEFRNYLKDLYEVGQELGLGIDVLESYPLCGIKDVRKYEMFTGRKCLAGVTTLTIASDGSVRPCSHLDVSYGNIFHEEVAEIWGKMDDWRNGKFLPLLCKKCKLLAICGAGCRMEAKMRSGIISAMDPYSAPEDVEVCLRALESERKKNKDVRPGKEISAFVLNQIRWREESFGAVVMVSKKQRAYLDHRGTKVLKQIKPGEVYVVDDKRLDWGGLESRVFVEELVKRKIILPLQKGGAGNVETRV